MKSSRRRADFNTKSSGSSVSKLEERKTAARQSKVRRQTTRSGSAVDGIKNVVSETDCLETEICESEDEVTVVREDRALRLEKSANVQLSESDTQVLPSTVLPKDNIFRRSLNSQGTSLRSESTTVAPKVKMSNSELRETRRKAAARLGEKRSAFKQQSMHESDMQRYECTLERVKWRANTKGKRIQELDRQVDRFILRDVILNNPQALAFADQHDFDCITGRFDESVWGDLLSGLEIPNHDRDWNVDGEAHFPKISERILSSVGLTSATKMIHRSKFDADDDIVVRTSVARLFMQKTQALPIGSRGYRTYDGASTMKSINSLEETERNLNSLEQLTTACAEDILAGQKARSAALFSPGMTQMQSGSETDGQLSRSSTINEPKKRLSLFAKYIPPDRKRGSFEDRGLLGDARSPLGVGVGSSSDDNSCISEGTHTVRLADSVFLVGPSDDEIEALVQQYLSDSNEQYMGGPTKIRANSIIRGSEKEKIPIPTVAASGASFEQNLEPKLLYLSHKDPEIEEEALPHFCYPR